MKKYIDIENLRLKDVELSPEIVRRANIGAFDVGDCISVQEKIDGSCASFRYLRGGDFIACSRRKVLDKENTLNGFYEYCERLAARIYEMEERYNSLGFEPDVFKEDKLIIFGEWTGKRNKIMYEPNPLGEWFVFDVYGIEEGHLLEFMFVEVICEELGLTTVKEIARINDFRSWDLVLPFANVDYSSYGDMQEGIVIKNQTKIAQNYRGREPIYLKYVNEKFREVKRKPNPEKKAKKEAFALAEAALCQVVTGNRIEKCIGKLQEDGIIPPEISNQDLQAIFKVLPRYVVEDIEKEEPEMYEFYKDCANKIITRLVVRHVKSLL